MATWGERIDRRLPLLCFLLSLAVYWPIATWFQSDDLVAITWARDPAHLLSDLVGPQYGLSRVALFWRPLITASFAVESWLGGGNPFWSHLDNALVHALNTVLVLLLLRRLVDRSWAARATLLWALHPAAIFSVTWAVGRVDLHSTCWILLAMLLHLRHLEGRGGRLPALLCLAAALATKELAICLPALLTLLSLRHHRAPTWTGRLARALRTTRPAWLLLALYFLLRRLLLGVILGGYDAPGRLADLPLHWGVTLYRLVTPLATTLGDRLCGQAATLIIAPAAIVVAALLTWRFLARRRADGRGSGLLLGGCLFLLAAAPMAGLLAKPHFLANLRDIRLFYLPLVGLALLLTCGGWRPTLVLLLLMVPVHFPARADIQQAYAYNRKVWQQVRELAQGQDPADHRPLFLTGLQAEVGVGLRLHLGADRLLQPPLGNGERPIYCWHPLTASTPHPLLTPDRVGNPLTDLHAVLPDGRLEAIPSRAGRVPSFPLDHNLPPSLGLEEIKATARQDPYHLVCGPGIYRMIIFTGLGQTGLVTRASPEGIITLKDILNRPHVLEPLRVVLDAGLEPTFLALLQRLDEKGRVMAERTGLLPLHFHRSALQELWPR